MFERPGILLHAQHVRKCGEIHPCTQVYLTTVIRVHEPAFN